MAVTYGNLIDRILYETNKSSGDFETGVKNAIITAIKYMEATHPWILEDVATVTITSGNRAANLPPDLNHLRYVEYNIGNVVYGESSGFLQLPINDLLSLFSTNVQAGHPSKYAIFADQLYVFPYTSSDTTFTLYYNNTDATYPTNDNDNSVWFGDVTVDAVRNKALEVFYRDTLQSPDIANTYAVITDDYIQNLKARNNYRSQNNMLSI